jgi:hypothetical protein
MKYSLILACLFVVLIAYPSIAQEEPSSYPSISDDELHNLVNNGSIQIIRKTIQGDSIVHLLGEGFSLYINDCIIIGNIDFDPLDNKVKRTSYIEIQASFDISNSTLYGSILAKNFNLKLLKGFSIEHSKIHGSLELYILYAQYFDLSDCTFDGKFDFDTYTTSSEEYPSTSIVKSNFNDSFSLSGDFQHEIQIDGTYFSKDVFFLGTYQDLSFGYVSEMTGGQMVETLTTFNDGVFFYASRVNHLDLSGAYFRSAIDLQPTWISIDARWSQLEERLFHYNPKLYQELLKTFVLLKCGRTLMGSIMNTV